MSRPLGELPVARLGEVLAGAGPGPAAGSTAAITAALAAGLATKVAKGAADREAVEELDALRARALRLADDDVEAFAGFLEERRKPGGGPAAAEAIVQVPADVVGLAVRVAELAALLAETGPDALTGDAVTAAFLAAAAAESAAALVGANIADAGELGDPRVEHVEERAGHARTLAERLV
ncbi:cyclodeaminase/cyclohydrolase family protein [Actinomycetospora straminea]|uniref:Cyclodeaminase/cyclohydrolase domain-containing protein n=1 Tax=Actinomycetospora straminea TaxID=663607 RepID=A0ABP9EDU0_9PSEU|nr:cyclodeaminase/cyclohydrolase family protein [Actinomycetospora straminea]MDD7934568.1 cyclodeaminase/cyclohydrolase family protein [Actinomycetospora straminea]